MISVVIIAKNEENRIKACLESVKWADEIIVVDDGSTDDTVQIAKAYTDKIIKTSSRNFSEKRETALEKVSGEWVFFVDADERVLQPLREEIESIISSDSSCAVWQVSRRNIILGKEKKYAAFWPDYVIRLFKKSALKGYQGEVHEQPDFEGELGTLKNSLLHLTHRDIDSMVLKSLDWSHIDAKLRFNAGHPPMSGWRFIRILITETFNQGISRRGFFNGSVGTIDALLQTFSLMFTYMRLWEMQQKPSLDEKYNQLDQQLMKDDFRY